MRGSKIDRPTGLSPRYLPADDHTASGQHDGDCADGTCLHRQLRVTGLGSCWTPAVPWAGALGATVVAGAELATGVGAVVVDGAVVDAALDDTVNVKSPSASSPSSEETVFHFTV